MHKNLWRSIKVLIVVGLLFYLIQFYGGIRLIEVMGNANFFWITLSALCFFLSIAAGSLQWYLLSKMQMIKISLKECFKIYYMGMFLNALIFNLAGDALRIYKIKSSNNDPTTGAVATFMDRFLGFSILSLFSFLAALFIWIQGILSGNNIERLFLTCLVIFLAFALAAASISSRRLGDFFQKILSMTGLKKLEVFYEIVKNCMLVYRDNWLRVLQISFISAGVHSFRVLGHYLCARALGIDISLAYFYCFIPIISLVTLIPFNIGGWGLPQVMGAKLYAIPGVIAGVAGARALSSESIRIAAGSLTCSFLRFHKKPPAFSSRSY